MSFLERLVNKEKFGENLRKLLAEAYEVMEHNYSALESSEDLDVAAGHLVRIFREKNFSVQVFRHKWKLVRRIDIWKEEYSIPSALGCRITPTISIILGLLKSKHLFFKIR
jgi:hypothetical protein